MSLDCLPASRWQRLCAHLLDTMAVLSPLGLGVVANESLTYNGQSSGEFFVAFGTAITLLAGLGNLGWFVKTGQTMGKRLIGIEVVSLYDQPVSGTALLFRSLAALLLSMVGVLNLVDPLLIFGSERRTLHDRLVGTRVVVKGSGPGPQDTLPDVGFTRYSTAF